MPEGMMPPPPQMPWQGPMPPMMSGPRRKKSWKESLMRNYGGGMQEILTQKDLRVPNWMVGKPVLVMRNTTERPEAVEAGTVLSVGTDRAKIEQGVINLMEKPDVYKKMSEAVNPYGDGLACGRIAEFLERV